MQISRDEIRAQREYIRNLKSARRAAAAHGADHAAKILTHQIRLNTLALHVCKAPRLGARQRRSYQREFFAILAASRSL
jgi:hypothetical protein